MNFFQIDSVLENTIHAGSEPVRIRIILSLQSVENITINHDSIETAYFLSTAEQSGLITSTAEITFFQDTPIPVGIVIIQAAIYFSCGNNSSYCHRFTMYPDDSNLSVISSGGSKTKYKLRLEDVPARLKRIEAAKDWSTPRTLINSVISDKEHPESSIFHLIAQKAGIDPADTESCTIPLTIPYAVIDRDTWNDLTDFTNAFKAVIEGGTDKKLILSDSRYQSEESDVAEIPEIEEQHFYRVDEQSAGELLKNDIRLRWNKPERLERQTLWTYDEPPVNYDSQLLPSYSLSLTGEKRRIEQAPPAEAPYIVIADGKVITAVYADEIDDFATVTARMQSVNGTVSIEAFDITTYKNKALVKITCTADDEIKNLSIDGRPIVIHRNCSCYLHDEDSITDSGQKVLNVTGRYFLDAEVDGTPHYQDWTEQSLMKLKTKRRLFTLYTQYCIFFIRAGAKTYLNRINGEQILCSISLVEMSYSREDGFEIKTELLETE
jgi:hypothetical protein